MLNCGDHEITIALDVDQTPGEKTNEPYSKQDNLLDEVNYQRTSISANINFR